MAEPRFIVRSARLRVLAHKLAQREGCSIAEIVERALEHYADKQVAPEPATEFFRRLTERAGCDVDLETLVRESRRPHGGIDL